MAELKFQKLAGKGPESEYLARRLREYNTQRIGFYKPKELGLVVYEDDEIVAGMFGFIKWGWLYLDIAWVKNDFRNQGLGTELLQKIQALALTEGVNKIRCETGSFQSLPFYLKNGFENYAQNNITAPDGSAQIEYLLRKTISHPIQS